MENRNLNWHEITGGFFCLLSIIALLCLWKNACFFSYATATFATLASGIWVYSSFVWQRKETALQKRRLDIEHFEGVLFRLIEIFREKEQELKFTYHRLNSSHDLESIETKGSDVIHYLLEEVMILSANNDFGEDDFPVLNEDSFELDVDKINNQSFIEQIDTLFLDEQILLQKDLFSIYGITWDEYQDIKQKSENERQSWAFNVVHSHQSECLNPMLFLLNDIIDRVMDLKRKMTDLPDYYSLTRTILHPEFIKIIRILKDNSKYPALQELLFP